MELRRTVEELGFESLAQFTKPRPIIIKQEIPRQCLYVSLTRPLFSPPTRKENKVLARETRPGGVVG